MYESYVKLTPNELHDRLANTMKMHPLVIDEIKTEVAALKETRRVERITDTALRKVWAELLYPLRVERDNAKVGLRYDDNGTASAKVKRVEAFTAYIAVLDEVLRRLQPQTVRPWQTPKEYARALNKTKKGSPIPNDGQHWTDWVPIHIKHAISEAFSALLSKPKARKKIPFQRVIPRAQHREQKERLLKRTIQDQFRIERMWNMHPTEENAEMYINVNKALRAIENAGPNDPMPGTWHGMLKNNGSV
jgi:hypothetical protein